MYLTYQGPHLEVEVPHDGVPGGVIYAKQGETVEVPDELAQGLLEQGHDSADDPRHQPQWKKASKAKADKAADENQTAGQAEKGETA